jgi:hypothetical protein
MNYGVEMASSGMMYIQIFIWIGSHLQTFLAGIHTHRHIENKVIS